MNDHRSANGDDASAEAGVPDEFAVALAGLGDELERAVARQIDARRNTGEPAGHLLHVAASDITIEEDPMADTTPGAPAADLDAARRRSRRRWIVAGTAGAVLAISGAAAAATGVFSTDSVERGMPGGSAIFTGTEATCTTDDDVVFDCTLDHAPTVEVLDDYTGSGQLIVDDSLHINGGCRGVDAEGLHWTCFVGQRAVDEGLLSQDLLGQLSLTPSHG